MKKLAPILALAVIAVGGFVALKSLGGGSTGKALQLVAQEAPDDAVGVAAVSSPGTALNELGARVDDDVRATAEEELGFDAFDPASYQEFGLNLDEPAGLMILAADPLSAVVTLGMQGAPEEARDAMLAKLNELEPPEDALVTTTIGGAPALLIEDEFAVVFDDDRVAFVFADLPWDTEDKRGALTEIATSFIENDGEAFADANDIAAATNFDGQPMMTAVFNPETLEELVSDLGPMPGWDEVTAVGFAVDANNDRVRMQARTVLGDDSQYFAPFDDAPSFGNATSQVPGPIEFGFRVRFDPVATMALLEEELSALDVEYDEMLEAANQGANMDVEEDVIGNLTGEIGIFLQSVPNEQTVADIRAVAFFGVNDTEAAAEMIAELAGEAGGMAQTKDVDGTTMYFVPVGPTVAFAAHDGYLWIGADDAAIEAILLGDSASFADDENSAAAADLFDNDHVAASFLSFTGQFGELVIDQLDESDAPGTEDLLNSIHNLAYEVGQDGDVMTADVALYWDGDAAGGALAEAFSIGVRDGVSSGAEADIVEVEGEVEVPKPPRH